MENFPRPPFESNPTPEKTGDDSDSKKNKKKTTRIPLPVQKTEAQESVEKPESTVEAPPKSEKKTLDSFFIKPEDQVETTPDADEPPAEETEHTSTPVEELTLPVVETPGPDSILETTPALSTEGELVETSATIFNRPESPPQPIQPEAVSATTVPENVPEAPVEAQEAYSVPSESSAESFKAPTLEFSPSATEAIPPAAVRAAELVPEPTDYEPVDDEPTSVPTRHRMVDPSLTHGPSVAARHHRAGRVEPVVTKTEMDDKVYRAEKRGLSRGVASGGVVGWWLGRRGKKTAERQAKESAQALQSQSKELKNLKSEQLVAAERLTAMAQAQEHLSYQLKEAQNTPAPPAEAPPMVVPELSPVLQATELFRGVPAQTRVEQPKTTVTERSPEASKPLEADKPKPEPLPEDQPMTEQLYKAPEGRRVETSSWHRYEVDAKSGKLVDNPELAYGEAFQRERQQELARDDTADPKRAAKVGHTILQGGVGNGQTAASTTDSKDAAGKKPDSPLRSALKDKKFIKQQLVRRTTSPITWVTALIIVVLLFVSGIL